ncbi:MAG: hypothetical protein KDC05_03330 [Bacteroidales bacterium]|nr:hypothetical protein [Bacteroidales bacterium]
MKITGSFILLYLMIFPFILSAQGKSKIHIGIEAGSQIFINEVPAYNFIRGDIDPYGTGMAAGQLSGYTGNWSAGAKMETYASNGKFAFGGGLRFTLLTSLLGKENRYDDNNDFFYLLLREEGPDTDYLKVKNVSQHTGFIGIPFSVKYIPYFEDFFGFFLKASTGFHLKIFNHQSADFTNSHMEKYEDNVVNMFEEPGNFYSEFGLGAGMLFGKPDKINLSLDANVPVFAFGAAMEGLFDSTLGVGIQINLLIPINTTHENQ